MNCENCKNYVFDEEYDGYILNESRCKNWIRHGPIDHFKSERRVTKLFIFTCLCESYADYTI